MISNKKFKFLFSTLIGITMLSSCSELNDAPPPPDLIVEKLTYTNEMKEIFDNNCIQCHKEINPIAGYDMTTYEGVVTRATAGDTSSTLVRVSIDGGSMHGFYDSEHEIEKVVQWVVEDSLAH